MHISKRLPSAVAFALSASLVAACGGGGGSGSGGGGLPATPTPSPTQTAAPQSCGVTPASTAVSVGAQGYLRRSVQRGGPARFVPGQIDVLYAKGTAAMHASLQSAGRRFGAAVDPDIDFPGRGITLSVVHVQPGTERHAIATFRELRGVTAVSQPQYRYLQSASENVPNDGYFRRTGSAAPYYQTSGQGGQWDMNDIDLAKAWGYALSNTTGTTYPGAIGTGEKIAVIDTGVDTTHPDLAGKIGYTATYNSGNGSLVNTAMVDCDGHGTNVAGIAAEDTNNNFGFSGAGYNAQIMAYRVFPNPPSGGCPAGSTNSACESSTTDIAAAINDAVGRGANVINLSLGGTPSGGSTCTTGGEDPAEAAAVANAISHGVVVVAAAGNEGAKVLDCPGGDAGVIAVGASSLTDGGTGVVTGEHVASYSNYDGSNASTWGVVAPGGDPTAFDENPNNPTDFYHWIENIYTSTASDGSSKAACVADQFGGTGDCRILIAGTSQATPHVSGVAALMLGAHPGLTPAQAKQMLCSSAVNIGDAHEGCGRIDAYHALAAAVGDPSP